MTMRSGEVYEHPNERLVVRVGTAESEGRELIVDLFVPADAPGVPVHLHPLVEESIAVISGKVEVVMAGKRRTLGPGDRVHIPARTAHGWRALGDDVCIRGEIRPGARFEEMWRQFIGLSQDGKLGPRGDRLSFLQVMALVKEFSDVMALPGPPICLQRAMATVLSPVAHLRGYQGRNEEYLQRGPSEIVELDRSAGVPAIASLGATVRRVSPEAGD
jgi:quercetin dioxygenase-like cupin family protein